MAERDELLEQFCVAAYPKLVAALTHYCGDVELGQELAQEALVVACRRWPMIAEFEDPVAWTYRVGVHHANSWFRRRRAEQRARARVADQVVDGDPNTTDRMAVRGALADLTSKQREAVVLRYFLDLSAEEVARLTGSSPGAVRALTHRAVRMLRDRLDNARPEEAKDAP